MKQWVSYQRKYWNEARKNNTYTLKELLEDDPCIIYIVAGKSNFPSTTQC